VITLGLPIKWGGSDPFTHMLVVGATRSGKTATILKPIIYQLLMAKKNGVELGLSVVEPKGDVAQMVADMSEEMGLEYTHIDPMIENSGKFNPMEGEINSVAEATVIVLKGLFGKQDAFFATVQELSARNVTKLLKELYGDDIDITDVLNTLRDPKVLAEEVANLARRGGNPDLLHFFQSELLGSMADKYRQFVIGLRAQLENIVSNDNLRKIMTGKSSIDIDEHYEKGGILAVNTALGMLRSSGDAFGQFVIMHLQNGAFRRPGTEDTRIPHFLIVDEYSRYINPDVEIFLSLAAEYRVAGIFAVQSLSQLEVESGKYSAQAIKNSILTNCRNKIVFGGVGIDDAKEFAEMFGQDKIMMRQSTYKNRWFLPVVLPQQYRDTETVEYRFDPTDIMDQMSRFTYIHQLVQDGRLQEPGIGIGSFVPRNWKELREWEKSSSASKSLLNRLKDFFQPTEETEDISNLEKEELEELEAEFDEEEKKWEEEVQKAEEEINLFSKQREDVLSKGQTASSDKKALPEAQQKNPLKSLSNHEDFSHSEKAVRSEKDKSSIKKGQFVPNDKHRVDNEGYEVNNINDKGKEKANFEKETSTSNELNGGENNLTSQEKQSRKEAEKVPSIQIADEFNEDDFWG